MTNSLPKHYNKGAANKSRSKKGEKGEKMNYFKITGLDEGEPIEPYGVVTYSTRPMISNGLYQDTVRYYEPITKEEYEKLTNKL